MTVGPPYPTYGPPATSVPPSAAPPTGLVPHLVWESALALLVIVVAVVGASRVPLFSHPSLWWTMGGLGLLATGLALSLRTRTPNLALPAVAALTATVYAQGATAGDWPLIAAAVPALVVAGLLGLLLGLVTGLTSAPAWAVTLGGLGIAYAVAMLISNGPVRVSGSAPTSGTGLMWFGFFVLLSLGGAALWLIPAVRSLLGGAPVGPRPSFRLAGLLRALVGLTGSSLLAGLAGIVIATQTMMVMPGIDIRLLIMALGAVLLGGVSVFGGRGGIAGTVLAVALLSLISQWLQFEHANPAWSILFAGLAILGGVLVSRLLAALTPDVSTPEAPTPAAPPSAQLAGPAPASASEAGSGSESASGAEPPESRQGGSGSFQSG